MKKFPIVFCIVLVFGIVLSGCGNPTSYSVLGISGGSVWPPDDVLTNYGIPGLKPSGVSSPQYKDDFYVGELTIKFNGTATTVIDVENYFAPASGWSKSTNPTPPAGETVIEYTDKTGTYNVSFHIKANNSFELDVVKDNIISGSGTL